MTEKKEFFKELLSWLIENPEKGFKFFLLFLGGFVMTLLIFKLIWITYT